MKLDEYFSHQLVSGFHPFFFWGGWFHSGYKGDNFRGLQNVARELQRRLEEECAKEQCFWAFVAGKCKKDTKKSCCPDDFGH